MRSLAILLTLFICQSSYSIDTESPLKVTIYYESYCPDCIHFFRDQLYPTWMEFKNNILLDLIPYGKAQQYHDGVRWHFACQHGPRECRCNMLHACAIHQACGQPGTLGCDVTSLTNAMGYINCVIGERYQMKATNECAKSHNLNGNEMVKCAHDENHGFQLLSGHGNRTLDMNILEKFVPWILFNGIHNSEAETHLRREICAVKPSLC